MDGLGAKTHNSSDFVKAKDAADKKATADKAAVNAETAKAKAAASATPPTQSPTPPTSSTPPVATTEPTSAIGKAIVAASKKYGLSTGAIAGISIGSVLGFIILVLMVIGLLRKKRMLPRLARPRFNQNQMYIPQNSYGQFMQPQMMG